MKFLIELELQELSQLVENARKDERQKILDKFNKLMAKIICQFPNGIDTTKTEELFFNFEQEILNQS